jgi:Putative peptidoglycan binding domain
MSKQSSVALAAICLALAIPACTTTTAQQKPAQPVQVQAAQPEPPPPARLAEAGAWVTPESVPPDAKPGECYTRVYLPPVYKTEEEKVEKRTASEKVEIIAAKYEEVEEKVLVKAASKRVEEVPAEYETATEQVIVKPGFSAWKKGNIAPGAQTKVDETTGEVLCLVEVPPETKTVTKQVLKTPATTREVEVPAEYKTVKVKKEVTPQREARTPIPAEYETVARTVVTQEPRVEWRQILCQTNSTPQKLAEIQQALKKEGFDPGRTDGEITKETLTALNSYQKAKDLPVDGGHYINVSTVKALGVSAQ